MPAAPQCAGSAPRIRRRNPRRSDARRTQASSAVAHLALARALARLRRGVVRLRAPRSSCSLSRASLARRSRGRCDGGSQLRILNRELLDAGEQNRIQLLLPPEVFEAVFVQPAGEREQEAALEKQQHRPKDGPVARKAKVRRELPVGIAAEKIRKQQRAVIASLEGAPEHD